MNDEELGHLFDQGIGTRKQEKDMAILDLPQRGLVSAWKDCVRRAMRQKIIVEDEITKARREHVSLALHYHQLEFL